MKERDQCNIRVLPFIIIFYVPGKIWRPLGKRKKNNFNCDTLWKLKIVNNIVEQTLDLIRYNNMLVTCATTPLVTKVFNNKKVFNHMFGRISSYTFKVTWIKKNIKKTTGIVAIIDETLAGWPNPELFRNINVFYSFIS